VFVDVGVKRSAIPFVYNATCIYIYIYIVYRDFTRRRFIPYRCSDINDTQPTPLTRQMSWEIMITMIQHTHTDGGASRPGRVLGRDLHTVLKCWPASVEYPYVVQTERIYEKRQKRLPFYWKSKKENANFTLVLTGIGVLVKEKSKKGLRTFLNV